MLNRSNVMSNGSLLLALLLVGQSSDERPRHPLAPSIPLLNKEEIKEVEGIIERLILYDIGKLKGAEGKKAVDDFNRLKAEAIFQLIDGFNRAANMESSCPCVLIAKKLSLILNTSEDVGLLSFAKENIGAGVTAARHMSVVKDLKLAATLRRTAVVARLGPAATPPPTTRSPLIKNSVDELADIIQGKGAQAKQAVEELGRRNDQKVADILLKAAQSDSAQEDLARATLEKWIAKQTAKQAYTLFKHPAAPVREIVAQVAGTKGWMLSELIDLLADNEAPVVQAARKALTKLSRGKDFGPEPGASIGEREESIARWRQWWEKK